MKHCTQSLLMVRTPWQTKRNHLLTLPLSPFVYQFPAVSTGKHPSVPRAVSVCVSVSVGPKMSQNSKLHVKRTLIISATRCINVISLTDKPTWVTPKFPLQTCFWLLHKNMTNLHENVSADAHQECIQVAIFTKYKFAFSLGRYYRNVS